MGLGVTPSLQREQQCQDLNRLAEPHVISEACTEAELRQQMKPAQSDPLVGA